MHTAKKERDIAQEEMRRLMEERTASEWEGD
jgi:hypothetical protein